MRLVSLLLLLPLYFLIHTDVKAQAHAREFDYLVDARSTLIDNSMKDQGYSLVKTEKYGSDAYQYWWTDALKKCVTVHISEGRILSVVNTPDNDCGNSTFGTQPYSYTRSSSYESYDERNGYNSVSIAYDRGFNDGLRNRSFHNSYYRDFSQKDAYADGYDRGLETRRKGDHWSGNSGSSYIEFKDLEGWGALRAYDELIKRGFEEERRYKQGGTTYRTWYHSRTGQCIKTVSQKERISETMISTHCD
ncbi:hypothetical protein [Robertkochia flava]|uniref:hypothetical protein n=1 Tax=Robertkochia flava TaxID=3447986 RepID=UPI001CC9D1A6|nr:hypothetical protein [Robertkochia marina]